MWRPSQNNPPEVGVVSITHPVECSFSLSHHIGCNMFEYTLQDYFRLILPYTSTPVHFRVKYCTSLLHS